MNIYGFVKDALIVYLIGEILYTLHYLINGVPLPEIHIDFGKAFLIGIFIVFISIPVKNTVSIKLSENLSTILSISIVFTFLLVIGKLFPIGIQYGKMVKLSQTENIKWEKVLEQGRKSNDTAIIIEKDSYYSFIIKNKKAKDYSIIGKSFVEDLGNIILIKDINTAFIRDFQTSNKNFLYYSLSVSLFLVVFLILEIFANPFRRKKNAPEKIS